MHTYFLVTLVLLGIALAVTAGLSRIPAFQRWQAGRLARRMGIGIPVELDGMIRRRVAARSLGSNVGGLVGLVAAIPAFLAVEADDVVVGAYLALALVVCGSATGTALAALRDETRPVSGTRVARAEEVRLGDYLISLLRILAWAIVVLAVATIAVSSASAWTSSARIHSAGLWLAVVGIVFFAAFEVVSRRIVGRGRPSASTDELVWNDALTSSALRDMIGAPVQAVAFGAYFSLLWSSPGPLGIALGALLLAAVLAMGFVFRSTRTWYLTQLWPGARRRTPAEEAARMAAAGRP